MSSNYKQDILVAMVRFLAACDSASTAALAKADVKVRAASNKASFDVASVLAMFEGEDRGVLAVAIEEASKPVAAALCEGSTAEQWRKSCEDGFKERASLREQLATLEVRNEALRSKLDKALANTEAYADHKVAEAMAALAGAFASADKEDEGCDDGNEAEMTPEVEAPSNVVQIKVGDVVPSDDGNDGFEAFKAARPHMSPAVLQYAWTASQKAASLEID